MFYIVSNDENKDVQSINKELEKWKKAFGALRSRYFYWLHIAILIDLIAIQFASYGPYTNTSLTHCGLVAPYDDIDMGHHWLR